MSTSGDRPLPHGLDDVVADAAIAKLVVDQLLVERLELDALVSIGALAEAGTPSAARGR